MPELPEVETTCRGVRPHIEGERLIACLVRERRLRWPVENKLEAMLAGQTLHRVDRRAKYLLLHLDSGILVIHLGMSGSLRILGNQVEPAKHDHFDLLFGNGKTLRYRDPRRFGALLWVSGLLEAHKLFQHLGPEPLSDAFDGGYLFNASRGRKLSVKQLIMNASVVVGVGNIYANEALFLSGIHPLREAGRLSKPACTKLVGEIKGVLESAIQQGGTTLKDFQSPAGKPGYFVQQLHVYGKKGEPCSRCSTGLEVCKISNRSTFFCASCQK